MIRRVTKAILIFAAVVEIFATPTTINTPPVAENVINHHHSDDLKEIFGHCLHKKNVSKCLKTKVIAVIDDILQSDDPMSLNLFNIKMSLKKNPHFNFEKTADESRSFEDLISQKFKSLLESRVIQMKLADDSKDLNEARKKKEGGGSKHGSSMMMSGKRLF